jgi:hypothetical protein
MIVLFSILLFSKSDCVLVLCCIYLHMLTDHTIPSILRHNDKLLRGQNLRQKYSKAKLGRTKELNTRLFNALD